VNIGALSAEQLVAKYRASALSDDPWDPTTAIVLELQRRGIESELLVLLEDGDPTVREWAGMHALYFAPEAGERALKKLEREGLGTASIVLKEWRAGLARPLTMGKLEWMKLLRQLREKG